MNRQKVYTVIGLMSGTSLDGVDAALLKTDGIDHIERIDALSVPYDEKTRDQLRAVLGKTEDIDGSVMRAEIDMTRAHAAAIDWLLSKTGYQPWDIDLVGFHGQTLFHDPDNQFTWQIGNGAMLARLTQIDVVSDFRAADVAEGGQGAPLLPLYHQALLKQRNETGPVAILNLGGVGNITYINGDEILAFDTGPGNALLDDWVQSKTGRPYDEGGLLARQGDIDETLLSRWLDHPYFKRTPPKSLDRDEWKTPGLNKLTAEEGAATLTAFTVRSVLRALDYIGKEPETWYVTGGGRHNDLIMETLDQALPGDVKTVEDLGWFGDSLEAEGFAYLAVRALKNLPLSLPGTTGVKTPVSGGRFHASQTKITVKG